MGRAWRRRSGAAVAVAALIAGCGDDGAAPAVDAAPPPGTLRAIAVGERGGIVELTGDTWVAREPPLAGELTAVELLGDGTAVAAGAGGVARRDADGRWTALAPPPGTVTALASAGELLIAGTDGGGLFALNGDGWRPLPSELAGRGWINDVDLAGPAFGLAVGGTNEVMPGGVLLGFDGDGWRVLRRGREKPWSEVAAAVPDLGFVGGFSDFIAGEPLNLATWTGGDPTPATVGEWRRFVTAIDAVGPQHALAFTDGGGTMQSTDGGLVLQWDGEAWSVAGTALALLGERKAFYGGCTAGLSFAAAVGPGPLLATFDGASWRTVDVTSFADRVPTLHAVACAR